MIAAAWPWVLAGIGLVVVLGVAVFLLVGAAGMPGDFLRRARQSARGGRSERGQELPGEVPDRSAEETAELAEDDRGS